MLYDIDQSLLTDSLGDTLNALDDQQSVSSSEPVLLSEMRGHLGIVQASDTSRDNIITLRINAARTIVEEITGKAIVVNNYTCYGRKFPDSRVSSGFMSGNSAIMLKMPLLSVSSITYVDEGGITQTLLTSEYEVDTVNGFVEPAYGKSWPVAAEKPNSVQIRYQAGYQNVPQTVKESISFIVSQWEVFQTSIEGVSRPFTIPYAARQLLEPVVDYRQKFGVHDFVHRANDVVTSPTSSLTLYDINQSLLTDSFLENLTSAA